MPDDHLETFSKQRNDASWYFEWSFEVINTSIRF